ncbi:hypothetical protein HID58_029221 [Brassica napus]|uniref:Uncharacterized protein n=1 Tax=Brassica napus TaxID=3708 RepID=A0ABQ8CCJ0_BRANA|nr:hypothetical protein HID58_029221 [Brassica napus]
MHPKNKTNLVRQPKKHVSISNLDFLVSNIFYKVPISIKVFFVFLCVY